MNTHLFDQLRAAGRPRALVLHGALELGEQLGGRTEFGRLEQALLEGALAPTVRQRQRQTGQVPLVLPDELSELRVEVELEQEVTEIQK